MGDCYFLGINFHFSTLKNIWGSRLELVLDIITSSLWRSYCWIPRIALDYSSAHTCNLGKQRMKKLILIFSVALLLCGCVKEIVHQPRYDYIFGRNDAILLSKVAVRNDKDNIVLWKKKSHYWVRETTPTITYKLWFEVYIKGTDDTVVISVPLEIYERYNPGDDLGF